MARKIRIGALISGGGSNLQAIIDACETGRIDGSIVFVGSDNPKAHGLKRADKHHIATFVADYKSILRQHRLQGHKNALPEDLDMDHILNVQTLFDNTADQKRVRHFFQTRALAEAAIITGISTFSFDLLVLAGFMRILTPYFIDRVNTDLTVPRIMNIHPALLPSFPGVDGYGDTFHYGCKVGGCTVHFVDYGEDTGPIIGQETFDILPDDTLESVREKGLRKEWELYPACVQLFAQDRLRVVQREQESHDGTVRRKKVVEILPMRR